MAASSLCKFCRRRSCNCRHVSKHGRQVQISWKDGKGEKKKRKSANSRGYTAAWQKARLRHIHNNPLCVECLRQGKLTGNTKDKPLHVDHITPHRGDWAIFWDSDNWQTLCYKCHGRKTARGE